MKFEKIWTGNWRGALFGLRHPLESYSRSDSRFGIGDNDIWIDDEIFEVIYTYLQSEKNDKTENELRDWLYKNGCLEYGKYACKYAFIGPNDLDLAQRMIKAGSPNDKFLRQIFVSVDITGPLYWWKEMDTYKVGTTTNSTSTMHKLASTPITKECFEMDDYSSIGRANDKTWEIIISICEDLRQKYNETKDIRYWKELIRILPESWLQTRTFTCNYAVLRNIVKWRKGHKLKYEWDSFIKWCQSLPYSQELLFYANGYENEYKLHDLLSSK